MPTLPPARTPFDGRESHQAREIAESFGLDADRYDRARPCYPGALVDRIVAGAAPSQHRPDVPDVLDVGCGTGIVARQFQAAGCRVLGVDPDARMEYSEPASGKGASFRWDGNDQVGAGKLTILDSTPDERVEVEQVFERPFAGSARMEPAFMSVSDDLPSAVILVLQSVTE